MVLLVSKFFWGGIVMSKKLIAAENFNNSLNCCQSIVGAYAEECGLDRHTALKISACFGGGMKKGEVCGAVSGALMVLGLKKGFFLEEDTHGKERASLYTKLFIDRYENVQGAITCKEILGHDISIPSEKAQVQMKGLFGEICPKAIETAIVILEDILHEE